ncbi:hypothetical protein [Leptothoe spongobia]|uniref:Uncharacterized protein n=1 Tax=Leptothoe spongobia TAU-MAC 1115 TaxID=1967444 RepID=A0A947DH33_9CYAN|nr:hypothetical protein [Leptothoe spongobia]MBT9316274.1 hypothetical protein [Leptothoe spongobia TAU-MAC 1115]
MADQLQAYTELFDHLPFKWFKETRLTQSGPFHDLIWALAGAIATARCSIEAARGQAIPSLSSDIWLSLHMLGIGLDRGASETDERGRARYALEFSHTRNTREGLLRIIEFYSGLEQGEFRLETDFAAGQYGALRTVIDAPTKAWPDIDFGWLDTLGQHYVANGIQVSVDIDLKCLRSLRFPVYEYVTPFPMAWGQLGPLYERPAFIDERRLRISRNQLAFMQDSAWASEKALATDRFEITHNQGQPGNQYFYLRGDCEEVNGQCTPYICIDYLPSVVNDADFVSSLARPIRLDGFDYWDTFPRCGAQVQIRQESSTIEINGAPPLDVFSTLPEQENYEISPVSLDEAITLLSADDYSLPTLTIEYSSVLIAGQQFGQLSRFTYCAETIVLPVNEEIEIPDYLTVSFEEYRPVVAQFESSWHVRGNYHAISLYSLEPVEEVAAADMLLDSVDDSPPGIEFKDTPPLVADFLEYQGYWFVYGADLSTVSQVCDDTTQLVKSGFIPNVNAIFTRGEIAEFLEVIGVTITAQENSALELLGAGPWELKLGIGDARWGDIPPAGTSRITQPIATHYPSSVWWFDPDSGEKSQAPIIGLDGNAYLAVEFLFEFKDTQLIRELELTIGYAPPVFLVSLPDPDAVSLPDAMSLPASDSLSLVEPSSEYEIEQFPILDVADYRRMAKVDASGNLGIIYKIAARLSDSNEIIDPTEQLLLPAFRAGQSATGDPLRDQDYLIAA